MKSLEQALRSPRRTAVAALALVGLAIGGLTALTPSPAASAGSELCDQYASATVQDRYVVQNNRYGTGETQCVDVDGTGPGFTVTRADGSNPADGPAKSYPSIYNGCYHGTCSPGTTLPMKLGDIRAASSTVDFVPVDGAAFDSSYRIFLDPTPRTDGDNATEIDVWFNHTGDVHPLGTKVGTAGIPGTDDSTTVASLEWDVWIADVGGRKVLTLVSTRQVRNWDFDVQTFTFEAIRRGVAQSSWYLTSVQAGFEPWQAGTGLSVRCFASTVLNAEQAGGASVGATAGNWWDFGRTDGGTTSGTTTGTTTGGSTSGPYCPTPTGGSTVGSSTVGGSTTCGSGPAGTITSGGTSGGTTCGSAQGATSGTGSPSCKVTYAAHTWPGGFTADVTITDTGTSDINGWTLGFTLPQGQALTSVWNAVASRTSGFLTATNLAYNATIHPGGSQTFGFLGTSTGSTEVPTSFLLNGAPCS